MHVLIYACIHVHMSVYVCAVCMYTCSSVHACVCCMHIYMFFCPCIVHAVYMFISLCACVCAHVKSVGSARFFNEP